MNMSLACTPRQFGFSTNIDEYNNLRYTYQELATQAVATLSQNFNEIFPDLETFHQEGLNVGRRYLQTAVQRAIQHLIEYRIHNIDENSFFATYTSSYNFWDEAYEEIDGQFLDIMETEAEKDAQRTARRQNRGK